MAYRPHRSSKQWQQLIDQQSRSSQSAREFCADHDIGYASFIQWRSRLTPSTSSTSISTEGTPEFVELTAGLDEHHHHKLERLDVATPISIELDLGGACSCGYHAAAEQCFSRKRMFGFGSVPSRSICESPITDSRHLVKHRLEENPLPGHFYVFVNRRKTQKKILCFDRNGYAIWSKRLEQGQFVVHCDGGIKRQINFAQLQCLLEGIELENTRQYKRFYLPES